MHQVETPIHWLWLARGTEPTINVGSGGSALVMIGDFEKDFKVVGEGLLKVPLFKLSVRTGSSPSLESRIADHVQMTVKWARALKARWSSLNIYGTLKSKGTQGGSE